MSCSLIYDGQERELVKCEYCRVLYNDEENKKFIDEFSPIVASIFKKNKLSYIVGDFNYNLINITHHQVTQDYYNLLTTHMYQQVITKPTRITEHTATLIDHIWHNDISTGNKSVNCTPGIIIKNISDHLPIYLNIGRNNTGNHKVKTSYRLFTTENFETYRNKLREIRIDNYLVANDINTSHQTFTNMIMKIINEAFPIKTKYIRQKTLNNKWLDNSLLADIKLKDRLFAKKLKKPTQTNIDNYHLQLKKVETNKKLAKRKYFREELTKYSNNIKKKWNVLREIILKKRKIDDIRYIYGKDKEPITDKTKISQIFVQYFQSIGSDLAAKFKGISDRRFQRWL